MVVEEPKNLARPRNSKYLPNRYFGTTQNYKETTMKIPTQNRSDTTIIKDLVLEKMQEYAEQNKDSVCEAQIATLVKELNNSYIEITDTKVKSAMESLKKDEIIHVLHGSHFAYPMWVVRTKVDKKLPLKVVKALSTEVTKIHKIEALTPASKVLEVIQSLVTSSNPMICHVLRSKIAEKSGYTVRTISDTLKELEVSGYIKRGRMSGNKRIWHIVSQSQSSVASKTVNTSIKQNNSIENTIEKLGIAQQMLTGELETLKKQVKTKINHKETIKAPRKGKKDSARDITFALLLAGPQTKHTIATFLSNLHPEYSNIPTYASVTMSTLRREIKESHIYEYRKVGKCLYQIFIHANLQ